MANMRPYWRSPFLSPATEAVFFFPDGNLVEVPSKKVRIFDRPFPKRPDERKISFFTYDVKGRKSQKAAHRVLRRKCDYLRRNAFKRTSSPQ